MAENIAEGIQNSDSEVSLKLFNLSKTDKNDVIAEVFKSKAILVGSPTINRGILVPVVMSGVENRSRLSVRYYKECGFDVGGEGLRVMWNPDSESMAKCFEYGRQFSLNVSV
ncbi:MAG: hypothetical protein QF466_05825 [Desulfobacterales bacterium]|jgi:flavorubredoxin|nr:hypothetical protein [Desulfobacterales bacterium]MDP6682455.1 hypothetical protein [Desulfobacterales bacterium]MDP6807205.1 hypothetical protein [Desulfobacterales bacterium]